MFKITKNLHEHENKISSQFGEDGVVSRVCRDLGISRGTFFEFGIGPPWQFTFEEKGLEGNFVQLRESGWDGIFMDGREYSQVAGVIQEFVTALNINTLWQIYRIPADLDFLSIDVDGQELWIWMNLYQRPKVVIVEYNGSIGIDKSLSIQFDVNHVWDGSLYHGASLRAFEKVGNSKQYTLVWANGVNAMFVRNDLILNQEDFIFAEIHRSYPPHAPDLKNQVWVQI